tara:strand:- start:923 stop:1645 length:723 start_codon:yes stop_codon:yes gene_type:complete
MSKVNIFIYISILLVWEAFSNDFLPAPSEILIGLPVLYSQAEFWNHVLVSLLRLVASLSIGLSFAFGLGILIGYYPQVRKILLPFISMLFPIPKIALFPLFIVWFGLGEAPKIIVVTAAIFFPAIIYTYSLVRNNELKIQIEAATILGASNFTILLEVIFPSILPDLLSNSRTSIAIGLIVLVSAELLVGNEGIGYFIGLTGSMIQFEDMFGAFIVLSLFGLGYNWLISLIERRCFGWKK